MSIARVQIVQNPWKERLSTNELASLLLDIAVSCERSIRGVLIRGEFTKPYSLGMVILNPSAPTVAVSLDAVLAMIVIGQDREAENPHLEFAAGKVLGSTRWGRASRVNGIVGGGFGIDPLLDRLQTDVALASLSYELACRQIEWTIGADRPHTEAYGESSVTGERLGGVHSLPILATYIAVPADSPQPYFENPDGSPRED